MIWQRLEREAASGAAGAGGGAVLLARLRVRSDVYGAATELELVATVMTFLSS